MYRKCSLRVAFTVNKIILISRIADHSKVETKTYISKHNSWYRISYYL